MKITELVQEKIEQSSTEANEEEEPLPQPSESQFMIHNLDGPYLMERTKWSKLVIQDEEEKLGGLTQEDILVSQETVQATQPVNQNGVPGGEENSYKRPYLE